MKPIHFYIVALCFVMGCGKDSSNGPSGGPSVGPFSEPRPTDDTDLMVPHPSTGLTIEAKQISVIDLMKKMSRFTSLKKTAAATARGFERYYGVQCNPLCDVRRK